MLSHNILQLESIDGPEKVRRHLSIRGAAHVTSVSHSPSSLDPDALAGIFIIVTILSRESSVAAVKPIWYLVDRSLDCHCAVELPPSLRITDIVWGALDKYFLILQLMLYSMITLALLNYAR